MIFISYSSKDEKEADNLVEALERAGMNCWISHRDLIPGKSFPSQIVKAIRECDYFVLVASDQINHSGHISNEVARAFDFGKKIIPYMISNVSFSDDYLYYISQIQWINAYSDLGAAIDALIRVMNEDVKTTPIAGKSSVQKASQEKRDRKELRIARYHELVDSGMTAMDIAARLVENDYNLYPGMTPENEGEPEQWAEYLSTFPETFRYLVTEENQIVGNWSFLAVSEEVHAENLKKGELTEDTFSLDETEYILLPGEYVGYLLNLSVNIEYNNAKNLNMLIAAFAEQMLTFAEDGIFFKAWYVNVFRKDHEAMYRRLGFKFYTNNKRCGKLYFLDCEKAVKEQKSRQRGRDRFLNYNNRLMELYNEHYDE